MKKENYIPLTDFVSGNIESRESEWYKNVIKNCPENQLKLIEENPELASRIFNRYECKPGLRRIAIDESLPESLRKNARKVFDDFKSFQKKESIPSDVLFGFGSLEYKGSGFYSQEERSVEEIVNSGDRYYLDFAGYDIREGNMRVPQFTYVKSR